MNPRLPGERLSPHFLAGCWLADSGSGTLAPRGTPGRHGVGSERIVSVGTHAGIDRDRGRTGPGRLLDTLDHWWLFLFQVSGDARIGHKNKLTSISRTCCGVRVYLTVSSPLTSESNSRSRSSWDMRPVRPRGRPVRLMSESRPVCRIEVETDLVDEEETRCRDAFSTEPSAALRERGEPSFLIERSPALTAPSRERCDAVLCLGLLPTGLPWGGGGQLSTSFTMDNVVPRLFGGLISRLRGAATGTGSGASRR